MSGTETWSIVAPILANWISTPGVKQDVISNAYVIVYCALKEWDDNHDEAKLSKETKCEE